MNPTDALKIYRRQIADLAQHHGARDLRVFGSVARQEATEHSDLDLLVNFEPGRSLFDLIGFEQELEDLLGCHVHVVTEGGLKSKRRETILSEATAIYGP